MAELKLSGNHLKGSRPVLSFSKVIAEPLHIFKRRAYINCSWTLLWETYIPE